MKILRYKDDGNTPEIVNKKLEQVIDNIYYYEQVEKDYYIFYYFIKCKNDIFYPLTQKSWEQYPPQAFEKFKNYTEKEILQNIEFKMKTGQYVSNLDILFCEVMEQAKTFVEELKNYKQQLMEKLELERQEKEQKQLAEEQEKQKLELEQKKLEQEQLLAKGYANLKAGEKITPQQFEALCKAENVSLPLKLTGWLREFCGDISIKSWDKEFYIKKYGYFPNFVDNFDINYQYVKGHKSTSLNKYACELASKVL